MIQSSIQFEFQSIIFRWRKKTSPSLINGIGNRQINGKQINQIILSLYIIWQDMARTKQTARKTCANKIPRRQMGINVQQQEPENVNTDQFSLKFDDQKKCEEMAVQHQVLQCQKCQAFLTSQSQILKHDQYSSMKSESENKKKFLKKHESVWICEFCLHHNSVPSDYVPPKQENPCLILKKGKESHKIEEQVSEEDQILIFCIDISGSMDVVFEGKSRLNSVKEAITDQINRLKFEKSNIKVGLITFGSEVNLIGDGKKFQRQILNPTNYHDFNKMTKESSKITDFCEPLPKSYTALKKVVGGLKTSGLTALGPGLVSAVQIASKGAVGSKVILCTDGEANVGIGGSGDTNFYTKMANEAKKKKVTVNILSLKGDNCNLKQLGKLSLATGGSLLKIDPKALGTQFSKIMEDQILGTESQLTVKLNKIFRICNHPFDVKVCKDGSTMTQDYGNFSADTELMFEFETIHKEDAQKISTVDIALYKRPKVPIQVQLQYTGRKSERYLQIITDWRQLVENEDDVYDGANFGVFAASVLQRASQKIKQNDFNGANSIIKSYWKLLKEKFEKTQTRQNIEKFNNRINKLEKVMKSKQQKNQRGGSKAKVRSRGRGRKRSASRSRSRSLMSSDSQEEVLMKEIRARSRSRSRDKKSKKK